MKIILLTVLGSLAALFLAPYAVAAGKKLGEVMFKKEAAEDEDADSKDSD